MLLQILLLVRHGYRCDRGWIWYDRTRQRVEVPWTREGEREVLDALAEARAVAERAEPPPPLKHSNRCPDCALLAVRMPDEINELAGRDPLPPRRLLARDPDRFPCYVTEPGSTVGVHNGRIVVTRGGERQLSMRLRDVLHLVLSGPVQVSSQAVHALAEQSSPVVWTSTGGWLKAVAVPGAGKHVELRRRQYTASQEKRLDFARALVLGKVRNCRTLLRRTSGEWLRGFAAEAVRLLENQLRAIEYAEPLKLLFVAPTQEAARSAALALNRVTGRNFARLVTSDEPGALRTLRLAAQENRSCGIVAVRMITEGFDCPQISTIAYATNVTAPLFISQMMARAMRLTATEKERNAPLPANILVPDHPVLCEAFAAALANTIPPVDDQESTEFVPKDFDAPRNPRYELLGLDAPWFSSAKALEQPGGSVSPREVEAATAICEKLYIPVVLAPRVALGFRDWNE